MQYKNISTDLILDFLSEFPEKFSTRKKKDRPDPNSTSGRELIKKIIIDAKNKKVARVEPKTIPDPAVSIILKELYKVPEQNLQKIKLEHQYSMLAEDAVGELLEDYIDYTSINSGAGWTRAYGDVIRSVDFIKKEDEGWRLLQIKNRDNSENSSSQSVRDGTTIEKWFRTFSRSGKTNWNNFPDLILRNKLSEAGFFDHIKQYFSGIN